MLILHAHAGIGILLILTAIVAIFVPIARTIIVYVLLVQVLLGVVVWRTTGLLPPIGHWVLAILVGGIYPMANAFERKGRPKALVTSLLVLGALIFIGVYGLGEAGLAAQQGVM
jgi:hypothetical protein